MQKLWGNSKMRDWKTGFLGVGLWLLGSLVVAQGKIAFKNTVHNFGKIQEELGRVEAEFVFYNKGTVPVKLTSVKSSCGCTTSDWTRDEVAPGDSGKVKAIYNPDNRPGPFEKGIVVTTDAVPSSFILRIQGDVIPKPKGPDYHYPFQEGNIRFKTNHIAFGTVFEDEVDSAYTILYNLSDKPIHVLPKQTQVPPYIRVIAKSRSTPPHDTLRLDFQFNPKVKKDCGFNFEYFFLGTDDPEKAMKRINVSADIREHFNLSAEEKRKAAKITLNKETVDFGKIPQSQMVTTEFTLTNSGLSPLIIRKVQASCGCTVATPGKYELEPGETTSLSVEYNRGTREGKQQKDITLIVNDPNKPVTTLKIMSDVVKPKAETPPAPSE